MFEKFTDRARKVFAKANQEARRLCHEYIGTEHILLGLVEEGSGIGRTALNNLGVTLSKVREEVELLVRKGPDQVISGKLPYTPWAKKVVEFAIKNARKLNHNYVGTEHLLLGLIDVEEGIAAQVLLNMGLDKLSIVTEVGRLLGTDILGPDNCKLCESFGYCYITQTLEHDKGAIKFMFEDADEMMLLIHKLFAPKCKKYKRIKHVKKIVP